MSTHWPLFLHWVSRGRVLPDVGCQPWDGRLAPPWYCLGHSWDHPALQWLGSPQGKALPLSPEADSRAGPEMSCHRSWFYNYTSPALLLICVSDLCLILNWFQIGVFSFTLDQFSFSSTMDHNPTHSSFQNNTAHFLFQLLFSVRYSFHTKQVATKIYC